MFFAETFVLYIKFDLKTKWCQFLNRIIDLEVSVCDMLENIQIKKKKKGKKKPLFQQNFGMLYSYFFKECSSFDSLIWIKTKWLPKSLI